MNPKSLIKVVWGFVVLWAVPIWLLAYLLQTTVVSAQSAAAIAALYVWSAIVLMLLLPARLPKRMQSLAAGMMAIALIAPLKTPPAVQGSADIRD